MKILIVGATGAVGSAIVDELGARHDIIRAGRKGPDLAIDVTDQKSIADALKKAGPLEAIVSAVGKVTFKPLVDMTAEDYAVGLKDKLMGQVGLVLAGEKLLADGGSFTLTSGILSLDPIRAGSSASMVNGAIDSFVRAASIELPRGLRINAVSPTVLTESMGSYGPFFRGFESVAAARAALAYAKSVEGALTGQVFRVP
jgi:NAD(P)-dependent dehydrogenase (short-subunit alcohol dehydrogenase family)